MKFKELIETCSRNIKISHSQVLLIKQTNKKDFTYLDSTSQTKGRGRTRLQLILSQQS